MSIFGYKVKALEDGIACATSAGAFMDEVIAAHTKLKNSLNFSPNGTSDVNGISALSTTVGKTEVMANAKDHSPSDVGTIQYKLAYMKYILDGNETDFLATVYGYDQTEIGRALAALGIGNEFGANACGLCTNASLIGDLLGIQVNPLDLVGVMGKDMSSYNQGTSIGYMEKLAAAFGLSYVYGVTASKSTQSTINEMLDSGHYDFCCTVNNGGHWYGVADHKIVNGKDMYLVVDSYPGLAAGHTKNAEWLTFEEAFSGDTTTLAISDKADGVEDIPRTNNIEYQYYNSGSGKTNMSESGKAIFEGQVQDFKDNMPDKYKNRNGVIKAEAISAEKASPDLYNFIDKQDINEEDFNALGGKGASGAVIADSESVAKEYKGETDSITGTSVETGETVTNPTNGSQKTPTAINAEDKRIIAENGSQKTPTAINAEDKRIIAANEKAAWIDERAKEIYNEYSGWYTDELSQENGKKLAQAAAENEWNKAHQLPTNQKSIGEVLLGTTEKKAEPTNTSSTATTVPDTTPNTTPDTNPRSTDNGQTDPTSGNSNGYSGGYSGGSSGGGSSSTKASKAYILTIKYVYAHNPSYVVYTETKTINAGDAYNYTPRAALYYNATPGYITGVMPESNFEVLITYVPINDVNGNGRADEEENLGQTKTEEIKETIGNNTGTTTVNNYYYGSSTKKTDVKSDLTELDLDAELEPIEPVEIVEPILEPEPVEIVPEIHPHADPNLVVNTNTNSKTNIWPAVGIAAAGAAAIVGTKAIIDKTKEDNEEDEYVQNSDDYSNYYNDDTKEVI